MIDGVDDRVKRFPGLYEGFVLDNRDPLGQSRAKLHVLSVAKQTTWALPFGTAGGGSAQRGGWIVPEVGAQVYVMFVGGNPDRPVYACGSWPTPPSGPLRPVPLRDDVPPEEAHLVPTLQLCGGIVSIYVDERPGKRKIVVQDNRIPSGPDAKPFAIVWDLEQSGLSINMDAAVLVKAIGPIVIEGLFETIHSRLVRSTGKPF